MRSALVNLRFLKRGERQLPITVKSRSEETVKDARSAPRSGRRSLTVSAAKALVSGWPGSIKQSVRLFDFYPCRYGYRTPHALCERTSLAKLPHLQSGFIGPGAVAGVSNQSEKSSYPVLLPLFKIASVMRFLSVRHLQVPCPFPDNATGPPSVAVPWPQCRSVACAVLPIQNAPDTTD